MIPLNRSILTRLISVFRDEGWSGLRERLRRRQEARRWDRLDRETETWRERVQRQIKEGRVAVEGRTSYPCHDRQYNVIV